MASDDSVVPQNHYYPSTFLTLFYHMSKDSYYRQAAPNPNSSTDEILEDGAWIHAKI